MIETDNHNIFKPHSEKQERAITSKKRILLLGTGTQWGKTSVGGLRMKLKTHQYTSPEDNFLILSPTYKTMMQSTLPPFLKMMRGFGEFNQQHQVFKIHGGGNVFCRTETDPDSIVGITNVRHIWGDESGKYRLYFWENIQARADYFGCGIDLTTSPYSLNWIYKELIKPTRQGFRNDVELVQAASWENPFHSLHDPQKLADKKATMDPRRFEMIYGGHWGKMVGVVYDCFDEDDNQCDQFALPTGTRFFAGIDWGYNPDPFVLKIRAVTPDGYHFGVNEFYRHGLTVLDMIELCKQQREVWGIARFIADPSQPGYIEEFNRAGLPCVGADNDIPRGISLHYEILKTRRLKYFRGKNPHTLDEYEQYHYPEPKDLGPDEHAKEPRPVDQNNHCMDTDRYLTIELYRSSVKLVPKTPEEKAREEHRIERTQRLMKRRASGQTENWD